MGVQKPDGTYISCEKILSHGVLIESNKSGGQRMSINSTSPKNTTSYPAAVILFGSLLPIPSVAAIITASLYILPLQNIINFFGIPWPTSNTGLPLSVVAILAGFVITVIFLSLTAIFFRGFTTMTSANPVSGSHLKNHYDAIRAGFDALSQLEDYEKNAPLERKYSYAIARTQVANYLQKAEEMINSRGVQWIAGTGYLRAWNLVHRAEEAMLALEPRAEVVREAIYDAMCLTGSPMDTDARILNKLRHALTLLSPSAINYLDRTDTPATNATDQKVDTLTQLSALTDNNQEKLSPKEEGSPQANGAAPVPSPALDVTVHTAKPEVAEKTSANDPAPKPSSPPPPNTDSMTHNTSASNSIVAMDSIAEMEARNALRDIRRTINEYRDRLWEGLVTERNQLMGTAIITGVLSYALLCFTIIANASPTAITAATAFYLVGSLTGLFSQLYTESQIDKATDDYDLTLARIIVTPVLAGLTAVGGVLLTTLISLSLRTSGNNPLILQDGFNLQSNPLGVLIAAAFSLAPRLFIGALTQKAQGFITQLQLTSASDQTNASVQPRPGHPSPHGN
jgi:hypothetical protein